MVSYSIPQPALRAPKKASSIYNQVRKTLNTRSSTTANDYEVVRGERYLRLT